MLLRFSTFESEVLLEEERQQQHWRLQTLRFSTSEVLLDEDVAVSLNRVMTIVRVMRGSATESRWLPVTVTSVPPLKTKNIDHNSFLYILTACALKQFSDSIRWLSD